MPEYLITCQMRVITDLPLNSTRVAGPTAFVVADKNGGGECKPWVAFELVENSIHPDETMLNTSDAIHAIGITDYEYEITTIEEV